MIVSWSAFAAFAGSAAVAGVFAVSAPRVAPPQGVQKSTVPQGKQIAGISCDAMEGAKIHIHQHLSVIDHGQPVLVPLDVGRPQTGACLYWIHTHTPDGVIHVESPTARTFTLGDFFTIWGQPLTHTQAATAKANKGASLKVWVDGKPYTGDPRTIPLATHTDVVIEAGPPFPKPERFTAWGQR